MMHHHAAVYQITTELRPIATQNVLLIVTAQVIKLASEKNALILVQDCAAFKPVVKLEIIFQIVFVLMDILVIRSQVVTSYHVIIYILFNYYYF